MVVYNDAKREEKLGLIQDVLKAQKDMIQNLLADPDLDFDQILDLCNSLKQQRVSAKMVRNELDAFFQPTSAAPP